MMFLRRGPTGRARRPGILTDDNVARAIRACCAGTGRGRITDDGGNLAVAVQFQESFLNVTRIPGSLTVADQPFSFA